tara:strand:+ start:541 stop:1029 length:489 start_codon:yes stop_codon:yes gene_type:complete
MVDENGFSERDKRIIGRYRRFHEKHDAKHETAEVQSTPPRIKLSQKDYGDNPLEATEQRKLANYLDRLGVLWNHCPNERKVSPIQGARLKAAGVKSGVPDVKIYTPSPVNGAGTAIELKRKKGGRVSETQRAWLDRLKSYGWNTYVARGADDAIGYLQKLGF